MLFLQATRLAFSLAVASTGNSIAARIAIIAITTSSSIKVKARIFQASESPRGHCFRYWIQYPSAQHGRQRKILEFTFASSGGVIILRCLKIQTKQAMDEIPKSVIKFLTEFGFQIVGAVIILIVGFLIARWLGRMTDQWFAKKGLEAPLRM